MRAPAKSQAHAYQAKHWHMPTAMAMPKPTTMPKVVILYMEPQDQLKILWDFFNHTILHQNKSTIYFDASNNFYKTLCMRCLNGTAISFQTLNKNNVHKSIKILNAIPGPLN